MVMSRFLRQPFDPLELPGVASTRGRATGFASPPFSGFASSRESATEDPGRAESLETSPDRGVSCSYSAPLLFGRESFVLERVFENFGLLREVA